MDADSEYTKEKFKNTERNRIFKRLSHSTAGDARHVHRSDKGRKEADIGMNTGPDTSERVSDHGLETLRRGKCKDCSVLWVLSGTVQSEPVSI